MLRVFSDIHGFLPHLAGPSTVLAAVLLSTDNYRQLVNKLLFFCSIQCIKG